MIGPDEPTRSQVDLTRTRAENEVAPTGAPHLSHGGAIGPYRLLEKLGEGGMGEVWLAEQVRPVRRHVAIKVIKAGMDTAQVVARFDAERQALAMMNHPTIAKIFEGGATAAGRPYFAMEYVRGEPITRYCDHHGLSTPERLELFIALCDGVQHAHQKGVIHRDLKPSNVLIMSQGDRPVPRIIDFGVARAIDQPLTERALDTQLGSLVGTPAYMSPEQAGMGSIDIDTRSDVYSLGVMLYELLVGTLPFDRQLLGQAGLEDMLRAVREQDAPRPSTQVARLGIAAAGVAMSRRTEPHRHARQLRGDLDWIVLKALEKDRTRRYQTANALALDVRRHLDNEPVSAGPPSTIYWTRKLVRRHRVAVSAAASLVVLLFAFAVSMGVQAGRIAREAERATSAESAALTEAATAKAVVEFLQNDLLAQAGPSAQAAPNARPDPDLKVRTALDRAAQAIPGKFDTQPKVEAVIRNTIGETYQDLGLYSDAGRELERAYALRRRELGDRHVDTLTTASLLGDVYRLDGKYAQAEPFLSTVVEVSSQENGADHPVTLAAMNNLAIVYRSQGKYAQAEPLYVRSLAAERRVHGERHISTLSTMNNLGYLYTVQAKYEMAETVLGQARRLSGEAFGEEHPLTLSVINNLALTYAGQGKYTQSEQLMTALFASARRVWGEEHPNTLTTAGSLADLYRQRGKYREAEPLVTRALVTGRRVQGEEHPNTLLTTHKLAMLQRDQGSYSQAQMSFTRVLESRRRVLGAEHPETLDTMSQLGELYLRQRRHGEAEALFIQVAASRRRILDEEHLATLSVLKLLGTTRLEQNKFVEAETTFLDLVGKYAKVQPNGWNRFDSLAMLGASLLGQGKYAQAEAPLLSSYGGLSRLQSTIPAHSQDRVAKSGEWILRLYRSWGRSAKVAEWETKIRTQTAEVR